MTASETARARWTTRTMVSRARYAGTTTATRLDGDAVRVSRSSAARRASRDRVMRAVVDVVDAALPFARAMRRPFTARRSPAPRTLPSRRRFARRRDVAANTIRAVVRRAAGIAMERSCQDSGPAGRRGREIVVALDASVRPRSSTPDRRTHVGAERKDFRLDDRRGASPADTGTSFERCNVKGATTVMVGTSPNGPRQRHGRDDAEAAGCILVRAVIDRAFGAMRIDIVRRPLPRFGELP